MTIKKIKRAEGREDAEHAQEGQENEKIGVVSHQKMKKDQLRLEEEKRTD